MRCWGCGDRVSLKLLSSVGFLFVGFGGGLGGTFLSIVALLYKGSRTEPFAFLRSPFRLAGVAGSGRSFIEYFKLAPGLVRPPDLLAPILLRFRIEFPDAVVRKPRLSYTGSATSMGGEPGDVWKSLAIDGAQLPVRCLRGIVT